MKRHNSMADFHAVARSERSPNVRSISPETSSPVQQLTRQFKFQSYLHDTFLQQAILNQPRNEPIVPSTLKDEQISGYAIGLHPSSQTPVAIQFDVGAQPSSSAAIILKPGQLVRPHGLPAGMDSGAFSGFRWGLPFGWLGGGVATLLVFSTPDADVAWPGDPELIFHRQRMQILAAGDIGTDAPYNWPLRFPWPRAVNGEENIPQQGQAQISVQPTRVILRLRLDELLAPATMRIVFQSTNDFDLNSAGDVVDSPVGFIDHTWDTFASVGAGKLGTQYPYVELGQVISRLAADNGGVQLIALDSEIEDAFVDVVRYGTL